MKKFVLLSIIIFCVDYVYAQYIPVPTIFSPPMGGYNSNIRPQQSRRGLQYTPIFSVTSRNIRYQVLDNGVYELRVDYESSTSHSATYNLQVRIQNDTVTAIYFGNGGSVHSGQNDSGYDYRGGGIEFNVDFLGEIKGGYARIQVTYPDGDWQLFTVYL